MVDTPSRALAKFAADLQFDDLPTDVVATLQLMILDSLGCAIAATTLGDGCRESVDVMSNLGGRAESSIIGTQHKVSAPNAAFANGALVHALNYDPIGTEIGHVGVVCLPAPLAMAEAVGHIGGTTLLAASAAACEISARITSAIARTGRRPSEKFLSGQLLSYFGAAAGAGRILGLDSAQMSSALGLALMQMSGSRQVVLAGDPPAKAIYGAFPNQAGVLAALLSKRGLGADCDIIGEPAGLYPMIYGGDCDLSVLTEGLGSEFLLNQVEFKLWPTSNHVHAFIEAAANLNQPRLTDVAAVEIMLHSRLRPWCEPMEVRRHPDNAAAAANSIPFCTAKALIHGTVRLKDFTPDGLRDLSAHTLADRTTCRYDDAVKGAVVRVHTNDGMHRQSEVTTPMGHRLRPVTRKQVVEKFFDCCSHASQPMSTSAINRLVALVDELPALDDIASLSLVATISDR